MCLNIIYAHNMYLFNSLSLFNARFMSYFGSYGFLRFMSRLDFPFKKSLCNLAFNSMAITIVQYL